MHTQDNLKKSVFRMGIFGASFNPLHDGHLNLLKQVQHHFGFDLIKVIPNWQSPMETSPAEVSAKMRLTLVRKVFAGYSFIEVDDQEIKTKTINYTIDTLKNISSLFNNIYLIMGIDQFSQFDKWKDFSEIIKIAHLVVCSRKGYIWNKNIISPLLQKYKKSHTIKKSHTFSTIIPLTTGKNIYYLPLRNKDVSSSQIRMLVKKGFDINHLVPIVVDTQIKKFTLYNKDL